MTLLVNPEHAHGVSLSVAVLASTALQAGAPMSELLPTAGGRVRGRQVSFQPHLSAELHPSLHVHPASL